MYGKKKLFLWAVVFALALPLMLVGSASAKYMDDGAVPDPAGGWKTPTDGICVVGLHADGTMDVADGITSKRDCIYLNTGTMNGGTAFDLRSLDGLAGCTTTAGDGAKHAASTSTCVDSNGIGISLKGLDRTSQMCTAKGGTWTTASKCVAYSWLYRGQDATGTPLAFGTKGTVASVGTNTTGFCYASLRTGITTTTGCPSGDGVSNASQAFGYSMSGGANCVYAYGINGTIDADLTKADGSKNLKGSVFDLSVFTTMGECLANGGSWANWVPMGTSTTTLCTGATNTGTIVTFDLTRQAVNGDEGCLHCHSSIDQANGPVERQKDSYLKTGHKNMLRKVTAGATLVGPDDVGALVPYTTDGTLTIDFAGATVTSPTGSVANLRYVFGDWMAALPTVAYEGADMTYTYGCGACHTAGFKDNGAKNDGVNANPGVQSIGTPGYDPKQPADSGAGYVAATTGGHKWDLEGIGCGRCHNATVPSVTQAMISASTFSTTAPTGGGMGALAAGVGRNNLCFGCHQSIAKIWPAQAGPGSYATYSNGKTQYNPTLIPTGVSHGASAGRDFNGHVLGNSFLNSVHARYAGVDSNSTNGGIKLNALGKYDLYDSQPTSTNTALEYGSTFRGYACYQSTTSASPAKTKADGTEIKDKATCEGLYGAGTWRPDTNKPTDGQASVQGTCASCHDVHNSLFVAGQEGIRKECTDCHSNDDFVAAMNAAYPSKTFTKVEEALTNHPTGTNTPWDTAKYKEACSVCHMALQAKDNGDQVSMPAHLWRINTSASYDTFPTSAQFNATDDTKDRNAQVSPETYTASDGTPATYANAIWVDLDLACGQCHVGSGVIGVGGVFVFTKDQLAGAAMGMHSSGTTTPSPQPTNDQCQSCHATGVGGAPIITPGTNHHGLHADCVECHKDRHNGKVPDKHDNTFCLTCHINTGPYAVHHATANVPAECVLCHSIPGVTVPAVSSANCRGCHGSSFTATTGETVRAVIQGTNHHNGDCLTCHKAEPFALLATGDLSSTGTYTALTPMLNATTLKPAGSHNPLPYWSIDTSLATFCLSCHNNTQAKLAGGSTGTIIPSGTGDNHHNGHSSVPGTSFGGVSEANGSRGDTDPGMNCLGCHGKATIISGNNATGYVLQVAASGLSTSTVAAQNGRTNTSGLCMGCHEVVQSGATQDHHNGQCVSCHHTDGTWSGTYPAGVGTAVVSIQTDSRDSVTTYCQQCHVSSATRSSDSTTIRAIVPSGTGDNHHRGSGTTTARTVAGCLYCHGEAGGLPFGSALAENMVQQSPSAPLSCNGACHTSTLPTSGQHHTGVGLTPTKGFLCLTCHNPADPTALQPGVATTPPNWTDCSACHPGTFGGVVTGPSASHHAVVTGVTCEECHTYAGQKPTAVVLSLQTNSRDSATNYCQQCHVAAQVYSDGTSTITVRAIVPSGTGDNHHRGSGTSTARIVAGCLYCHADPTTKKPGLPFGNAATEVMQDQPASGSCSGACHADAQIASGKHHTGTNAQGSTMTLTNNTLCLTCHNPADANALQPGVNATPAGWADCTACHPGTVGGIASGPSATHHLGTSCDACHTTAGIRPATAGTNCQGCHGQTVPTYMGGSINACTSCHTQGGALPLASFCQGCHNGTTASTWADSKMAQVHNAIPTAAFTWLTDTKVNLKVNYTVGTITCPSGPGTCTYEWDFGDLTSANSGTTKTTSHTFASKATYTTTLTVTSGNLNGQKLVAKLVTPIYVTTTTPLAVTALPAKSVATGFTYVVPVSAMVSGGTDTVTATIAWGDAKSDKLTRSGGVWRDKTGSPITSVSHVYANATTGLILPYSFAMTVTDSVDPISGKKSPAKKAVTKVTVLPYYIAGDVLDNSGTPIANATVTLKQGTTLRKTAKSNAIGQYLFSNVKPELVTGATTSNTPYTISVVKAGYTFTPFTFGAVIAPDSTTRIIIKDMTAN